MDLLEASLNHVAFFNVLGDEPERSVALGVKQFTACDMVDYFRSPPRCSDLEGVPVRVGSTRLGANARTGCARRRPLPRGDTLKLSITPGNMRESPPCPVLRRTARGRILALHTLWTFVVKSPRGPTNCMVRRIDQRICLIQWAVRRPRFVPC